MLAGVLPCAVRARANNFSQRRSVVSLREELYRNLVGQGARPANFSEDEVEVRVPLKLSNASEIPPPALRKVAWDV
ncbi:MAG: hypothetical protein JKY65_09885 [Planctomycetes bacterium]|nr:hypothetical protein [Planctomycetota bacterium]